MALTISSTQRRQMVDWAASAHPYECCGLLLGHEDMVERLEPAANVASSPSNSFEIDPSILIAAERAARQGGPGIVGYFHSHPDGVAKPSATDRQMAAADGRRWVIIAGGNMTCWLPVQSVEGAVRFTREAIVQG